MKSLPRILLVALALATSACRQPLAIQGEGDIIELNRGERGCALEEFRAGWSRCAVNEVNDTESLVYRALYRQRLPACAGRQCERYQQYPGQ